MEGYYKEKERQINDNLQNISSLDYKDILINLETSLEGISNEEAEKRLEEFGPN